MRIVRLMILVATIQALGCSNPRNELDAFDNVEHGPQRAVVVILQGRDCGSRAADLAVLASQLPEATVAAIRGERIPLGLLPEVWRKRPILSVSSARAAELRRSGVLTTPSVVAWNRAKRATVALSLSPDRVLLYQQLRLIEFVYSENK